MKKLPLPVIGFFLFLILCGISALHAQQPGQSSAQQSEELAEQGLLFTLATELPYRAGTYREEIEA
ncbi:MAG TPA: hypothetical protein PLH89_02275, partial [Rectinema sp.]|nr:hypothetical protein [Rectinema sp.]